MKLHLHFPSPFKILRRTMCASSPAGWKAPGNSIWKGENIIQLSCNCNTMRTHSRWLMLFVWIFLELIYSFRNFHMHSFTLHVCTLRKKWGHSPIQMQCISFLPIYNPQKPSVTTGCAYHVISLRWVQTILKNIAIDFFKKSIAEHLGISSGFICCDENYDAL